VTFLRWYIPVVIVAATLNLRPALITLGPVLPAIQRSLDLSPVASGVLTALPILALGLASAIAVPVGRKLGWSGGLIAAMVLVAIGIVLRSAGSETALFAGAALLGIGIGLGNVFVPTLVKARLAERIGLAMGGYTMALTCGALLGVALTPPLLAHFGTWEPTLAVWSIPAVMAALAAVPLLIDNVRPKARVAGAGLWKNGLAWAVSAYMGLQSALFYAIALWLAALLTGRGLAITDVAADLSIFYFTQFLAALAAPIVLTASRRQDLIAVALVAFVGLTIVAILYGPLASVFAFSGLLGVAMGGVFSVALTFQVIRARTTDNAARLSSMAQFVGYCIASIGPLVLGLVSKWPDPRLASTIWLCLIVVVTMIAGSIAGQPRFVDDAQAGLEAVPAN
jgi:CP family cyanate transporter-like MFS transporter